MRILLAFALLAGAPQDEKKGPKNKEVRKAYAALMADNGKENEAIKKDLDDKKGDAEIKARLMKIRKNVEAASKLDYLKGPAEEVEKFKAIFGIFLDIRMKTFLEAEWTPETSPKLYERLQGACRTCHELFRED
ncbi:MAG TPA: hypothetical protein VF950_14890 [Planctomycetota bacterium]